jgi:hypothetical protein
MHVALEANSYTITFAARRCCFFLQTDPSYYFWKKWRGAPWERESLGAKWGSELISGFG